MDAKGLPEYERLVESLAEKIQEMGETVAPFPNSGEEYLALELEERMEVATKLLRVYAPNEKDGEGTPAPADIEPADTPGVVFKGKVSFKLWMAGGPDKIRQRHHGIQVDVTAQDKATGVATKSEFPNWGEVGGIKRGEHKDEAGETQTGWYAWSTYDSEEHPLDGQFGSGLVEFVDTAVVGLLDGEMLTQHRQFLGSQAVEGAAQSATSA